MRRRRRAAPALLAALALVAACSSDDGGEAAADRPAEESAGDATTTTAAPAPSYDGYRSEVYGDPASWLCRPDVEDDLCDSELDATSVASDGTTEVVRWAPAADAPIDCFYVYPTISRDATDNSDLVPSATEEGFAVRQQAARLGSECRLFAPVYRQTTLTALTRAIGGGSGGSGVDTRAVAYADVLDAWKHYVDQDNGGRGVVLVGHSQGAGLLGQLIEEEIDGDEGLRSRLVSALLLGSSVSVPAGQDVGGDFAAVPLCRSDEQTGCVVSYASFRSTAPPPAGTFFGRSGEAGTVAACTNPAALDGGRAELTPYLPADGAALLGPPAEAPPWTGGGGGAVDTPFVTLPGFLEAECVERDGVSYLEVTVLGDPADPRIDDIGGDLTPEWGLHLVDANVAMGDLVDLVASQSEAYTAG